MSEDRPPSSEEFLGELREEVLAAADRLDEFNQVSEFPPEESTTSLGTKHDEDAKRVKSTYKRKRTEEVSIRDEYL